MRCSFWLLPLFLSGCILRSSAVPASSDSLVCAARTTESLGYTIEPGYDGAYARSFVARKPISSARSSSPAVGEIRAVLHGNPAQGYRLRVTGEEYELRRGAAQPPRPVHVDPATAGSTGGTPVRIVPYLLLRTRLGTGSGYRSEAEQDASYVREHCATEER